MGTSVNQLDQPVVHLLAQVATREPSAGFVVVERHRRDAKLLGGRLLADAENESQQSKAFQGGSVY
jgi:hypothetical protein